MNEAVLNVGLDPALVDTSASGRAIFPHVDAEIVEKGIADARVGLAELGLGLDVCSVDSGDTAAVTLREALRRKHYKIIMIGGGVRLEPRMTPLFEIVVNTVLQHSPWSVLCFNTGPDSTVEAVRRWWPAPGMV